jgi:serine protease Do
MGISLAVPIDSAIAVAAELRSTGRVRRGELGALIQELTPELALAFGLPSDVARAFGPARAAGALVTRVQPRSAAARAGLRSGDVVLGIDERRDTPFQVLQQQVAQAVAGTRLNLNVWRGGAWQRVTVVVRESRPDLPAQPSAERRAPRLGLRLAELSEPRRRALGIDGGLAVLGAHGAAARSGVLPYDIVAAVGAQPVKSLADFDALLGPAERLQRPIALLVLRDGQFRYLAVWP